MYLPIQPEHRRGGLSSAAILVLKTTAAAWALPIKPDAREAPKPFQTLPSFRAGPSRGFSVWPSPFNTG